MSEDHDEEDVVRPPTPPIQLDYRTRAPRHKPISFVAAQSADSTSQLTSSKSAISDSYLSLVLKPKPTTDTQDIQTTNSATSAVLADTDDTTTVCEICSLPLSTAQLKQHHTSTAHQVCLQHTHVPSSIDRTRKGLKYLTSYGFDPDARTGLGSTDRPGLMHPIKPKEKIDKGGVGATARTRREAQEAIKKMGPKDIKKMARTERRRGERLQRLFYSNGEVEKYLREEA